jgi:membrane-anchored protein YejM (alkaline phosphatase superfamily)
MVTYLMTEHLIFIFLITMVICNNQVFEFLATVTSTLIPGLITPHEGLMQFLIPTPL